MPVVKSSLVSIAAVAACLAVACCASVAQAGVVAVAVAANFAVPFQKIAQGFEAETGHVVQASSGSTGKFHAQIRAGAPFDVLLSADDETPRRLEDEGLSVKGQRFTYALGRLVLWSSRAGVVDDQGDVLRKLAFSRLAVANPKLAPYGVAAVETLTRLGLKDRIAGRLVQGENIAQTYQFVSSGNADLGFVALSQVMAPDRPASGSWWVVPSSLHAPLRQDAVLLQRGESNLAARALLSHLKGDKARTLMRAYGYEF